MNKSRFTDEQIIEFLKQVEGEVPVKDLCRKNGFSHAAFYKRRSRLGAAWTDVSDLPTRTLEPCRGTKAGGRPGRRKPQPCPAVDLYAEAKPAGVPCCRVST